MAEILLVDDDTNVHQIVSLFLEGSGHHVVCMSSGASGVDYALHNTVDLIILDLAMPVMDGVETLQKLRAHPETQSMPVLVLSVHQEHELDDEINRNAHLSFLNKPIDMKRLNAAVMHALAA